MLELSRNQAHHSCCKCGFASNDSSTHSKGDVWLEDGFIFRVWWFQLLFLVGGSVDSTAGPRAAPAAGAELSWTSSSPSVALGELCLCHLHYSSLGILLGHFFLFFFENLGVMDSSGGRGMPKNATGDFSRFHTLKATLLLSVLC